MSNGVYETLWQRLMRQNPQLSKRVAVRIAINEIEEQSLKQEELKNSAVQDFLAVANSITDRTLK